MQLSAQAAFETVRWPALRQKPKYMIMRGRFRAVVVQYQERVYGGGDGGGSMVMLTGDEVAERPFAPVARAVSV